VSWAIGWLGWSLALAAVLTLRRRMARLADAEHELRGAATAIALLAEPTPPLRLELDRLSAGLADLAAARGARVAAPATDLEAGRLAQVLGNVAANAAEHGLGPVAVRARRDGAVAWLEVANGDGAAARRRRGGYGRGRGLRIARRAARKLGGRLTVEREGGVTRAVVELPSEDVDGTGRRAA
jgi:signal transduction histidine kinase